MRFSNSPTPGCLAAQPALTHEEECNEQVKKLAEANQNAATAQGQLNQLRDKLADVKSKLTDVMTRATAASKELDTDRGLLADAQRNLLEAPDSQPIKDHIATLKGQIIDQEGKLQSAKADEPDLLAEQAEEKGEKAHWKEELDFWAQRAKGIREHIKSLGCDDPASAGAVGDSVSR